MIGVRIQGQDLDFLGALSATAGRRVAVGIRGGEKAGLLYLHSRGAPRAGIPARPLLEPAVEQPQVLDAATTLLAESFASLAEGAADLSALESAGALLQSACQSYFTGPNGWPSNKPSTLTKKGADTPLIDTGGMRAAITYEVI